MSTGIEWTDEVWNPVRGCSRVSAGCINCYAERQAIRQIKSGYAGLIQRTSHGPAWTGEVRLVPELLDAPLRWRSPRRVFVNSMSDLFHERVSETAVERVFDVMALSPQHTFQILTKRPQRMLECVAWIGRLWARSDEDVRRRKWPLPNVWLGVSVEDQQTADERIPLLLETPAAVRFVSYEPALGPVDFTAINHRFPGTETVVTLDALYHKDSLNKGAPQPGLDWVIVGGESGPGARPCDVAWIRSTVEQCEAARVACFVKQLGAIPVDYGIAKTWPSGTRSRDQGPGEMARFGQVVVLLTDRKGGDPAEWPADLRVREFPR